MWSEFQANGRMTSLHFTAVVSGFLFYMAQLGVLGKVFPSFVGVSVKMVEDSFECSYENMAITAMDPILKCQNSDYDYDTYGCLLGHEVGLEMKLIFSGLESEIVYLDVNAWKYYLMKYRLKNKVEIDLCENLSSSTANNGGCPTKDGIYTLHQSVVLPTMKTKDWFVSGYVFNGEVKWYADSKGKSKLGHCTFQFTATESTDPDAFLNPPSGALFSLVLGLGIASTGLGVLVSWLVMNRLYKGERKTASSTSEDIGTKNEQLL